MDEELKQAGEKLAKLRSAAQAEQTGAGPLWGAEDLEAYTEREIAPRLKVTRQTLRNWRKAGIGPPFTKIGRNVRYPHRLFVAWLQRQA